MAAGVTGVGADEVVRSRLVVEDMYVRGYVYVGLFLSILRSVDS